MVLTVGVARVVGDVHGVDVVLRILMVTLYSDCWQSGVLMAQLFLW